MNKQEIFHHIDNQQPQLFHMACEIFDHPEYRGKEVFAADLLIKALEEAGFQVERGVGGEPNSFRATWENGTGGPNLGLLGEYDALESTGHACGHHLQTPAAIGAAIAIKDAFAGSEHAFKLTVYGTPAEETYGGKIIMGDNGCFKELDIALASHATRSKGFVGGTSMALDCYVVTFHGKAAHASGVPWEGRSAGDAMFLSFNGIEHMREHVKDGTRMHYTVKEALGPSNVVPDKAVAGYTLRSRDSKYLEEVTAWFKDVVKGACLMTQTTAEFQQFPRFAARKRNVVLANLAKENYDLLGVETFPELIRDSNGSTDFGNVSGIVPGALVYLPYVDAPGHSQEWVDAGKTDKAKACMTNSAKTMAGILFDLIQDPALIKSAKEEFDRY